MFYFFFFFFSSRRRHTRSLRDWSSDVCSSDLKLSTMPSSTAPSSVPGRLPRPPSTQIGRASCRERSVDLGGRRIIKKKKNSACTGGAKSKGRERAYPVHQEAQRTR